VLFQLIITYNLYGWRFYIFVNDISRIHAQVNIRTWDTLPESRERQIFRRFSLKFKSLPPSLINIPCQVGLFRRRSTFFQCRGLVIASCSPDFRNSVNSTNLNFYNVLKPYETAWVSSSRNAIFRDTFNIYGANDSVSRICDILDLCLLCTSWHSLYSFQSTLVERNK
jgi:hypothetical protein